jgi:hypothetical protein
MKARVCCAIKYKTYTWKYGGYTKKVYNVYLELRALKLRDMDTWSWRYTFTTHGLGPTKIRFNESPPMERSALNLLGIWQGRPSPSYIHFVLLSLFSFSYYFTLFLYFIFFHVFGKTT